MNKETVFKHFPDIHKSGILRLITNSQRVQALWSFIIRNRKEQLKGLDLQRKRYCDAGCGKQTKEDFVNIDNRWCPGVDICWDIRKGIPLPDKSMQGVFAEHLLEHFSLALMQKLLREFHRILKEAGTLRVVVPDGEIYIDLYIKSRAKKDPTFPPAEQGYGETAMMQLNRVFRRRRHQFLYDAETLSMFLAEAGFTDIRKESFLHGRDPKLLVDREVRKGYSLYMEASA